MRLRRVRPALGLALLGVLFGCDETTVTVLEVASVDVSPSQLEVIQGDQATLTATPRDEAGRPLAGRAITWQSLDSEVASVDGDGRVEGRAPGSATIRATADGVSGTAAATVLPGRTIQLSESSVSLEAVSGDPDPVEVPVDLENGGAGQLTGLGALARDEDGEPVEWLEAALSSTSAPTTLQVRAFGEDLEPGSYAGQIVVTSEVALNSPVTLPVTLEVREPPAVLAVDPSSLSLSAQAGAREPATQTLEITNAGSGILDALTVSVRYTEGGASGWLSVALDATVAPTEAAVAASARDLEPGEYGAVIRVSSVVALNEAVEVTVRFTVGSPSGASDGRP